MTAAVPSLFTRYREPLTAEMRSVVGDGDGLLYQLIRYHLGWVEADGRPGPGAGGKALRPSLCLLAAEAAGGSLHACLPAAAAIELIHNFSLVHDDIEDGDRTRHGRRTVWDIWGIPQAINAGDGLWALAGRAFLRCVERGIPAAVTLRAYDLLNESCLTIIEGQAMDLAFEGRGFGPGDTAPVDEQEYLEMIARKTGALIAGALAVGAMLGSGDPAMADGFWQLGQHLGRVFQIQDDVLGIWGEEQLTGKSNSNDIRRRKQSYPVVYTLSRGPAAARAELAAVYTQPEIDDAAVARAVQAMDEARARERSAELAAQSHAAALETLTALPITTAARADIQELAAFLMQRQF